MIGPVLDADGVAVTGGVVGDFKISKNGGAPAALNGSATATHRHTGFYSLALTTSDLDTVGTAQITIDDTTNSCQRLDIQVIEEVIYDALYAASANAYAGSAGSTTLGSGAITAAAIATGAIDADAIADNAIDAGAIASDAITAAKIAAGAIDAATFAADVDAEARGWLGLASANLDTQLGDIPTVSEFNARTIAAASYALESSLTTIAGYIDTEIGTILTNLADVPTVAEFEARTLLAADYTVVSDLGTVQTGDGYAYLVANVGANGANLTAADNAVIAAIAALNNLSAAQVNAEIVDALATDTYAEPGQGTPAATTSITAKINYLYKAWRNKKTQTSTTFSLFADDASTVDQKGTNSDDGTTTIIGEIATGP